MPVESFAPDSPSKPQPSSPQDHSSQPNFADHPPAPDVILSFRLFACCGFSAFTILIGALVARQLEGINSDAVIEAIASCMVGAFFAIGMLAVIWPALGQCSLQNRAGFGFLLLLGIYILFFMAMGILAGGEAPPKEVFLGAAVGILGAWAIPTFPLWCLRKGLGVRFALAKRSGAKQEKQFSIGYLLAATGAIAIFLGVLRAALIQLKFDFVRDMGGLMIFGFFVIASFLVCFMFYIAALIPRYVALGLAVALLLTCLASYWELSLVVLIGGSGPPFRPYFFWLLNGSSALWTLIFALVMRMHGYRFEMGK